MESKIKSFRTAILLWNHSEMQRLYNLQKFSQHATKNWRFCTPIFPIMQQYPIFKLFITATVIEETEIELYSLAISKDRQILCSVLVHDFSFCDIFVTILV